MLNLNGITVRLGGRTILDRATTEDQIADALPRYRHRNRYVSRQAIAVLCYGFRTKKSAHYSVVTLLFVAERWIVLTILEPKLNRFRK